MTRLRRSVRERIAGSLRVALSQAPFLACGTTDVTVPDGAFELAGGGLPMCEAYGLVPERFLRTGDLAPVLASTFLHDPTAPFTHARLRRDSRALRGVFGIERLCERHDVERLRSPMHE